MSFSLGIIGLPNVGKSTLFHALTKKKVDISNYPFCTIDPNVGVVAVPDERLDKIAAITKPEKIIPTTIEFLDIAGLVKGASQGEGLGNKFLQNIRQVDAIVEVVREFANPDVTHVHGSINPKHDKEVIMLELILADLEVAERRLEKLTTQLKGPHSKELALEQQLLQKIVSHLKDGKPVSRVGLTDDELKAIKAYNFLTSKPILYVLNVNERDRLKTAGASQHEIRMCAQLESELADLPESEKQSYLDALGITRTGLNELITKSYELLNLITFFTILSRETKAWTVVRGTQAPQAAGVIHSDLEKGFIRCEAINWNNLVHAGSWTQAKKSGTIRMEGKEYVVSDGDVILFHFS